MSNASAKVVVARIAMLVAFGSAGCTPTSAHDEAIVDSPSGAPLSILATKQRLAASFNCPLWLMPNEVDPASIRCAVRWLDPYSPPNATFDNEMENVFQAGGVVGVALPCTEICKTDYDEVVSKAGGSIVTLEPGISPRTDACGQTMTVDPTSCVRLFDWARKVGQAPAHVTFAFIDSIDPWHLNVPQDRHENYLGRLRIALQELRDLRGLAIAGNVTPGSAVLKLDGVLDVRGVEYGAHFAESPASQDWNQTIAELAIPGGGKDGDPLATPSVMTASILMKRGKAVARTALAANLLLDIKTGGLAFTVADGEPRLDPELAPILQEFAALPVPDGPTLCSGSRCERSLHNSVVWYDWTNPSNRRGDWNPKSSSTARYSISWVPPLLLSSVTLFASPWTAICSLTPSGGAEALTCDVEDLPTSFAWSGQSLSGKPVYSTGWIGNHAACVQYGVTGIYDKLTGQVVTTTTDFVDVGLPETQCRHIVSAIPAPPQTHRYTLSWTPDSIVAEAKLYESPWTELCTVAASGGPFYCDLDHLPLEFAWAGDGGATYSTGWADSPPTSCIQYGTVDVIDNWLGKLVQVGLKLVNVQGNPDPQCRHVPWG